MKSSMFIVAASAFLAAAAPLEKRVMETKWVEEIVTVTVTADPAQATPASKPAGVFIQQDVPKPTSKPASAPAPKPIASKPAPKPSYQAPSPAPSPIYAPPPAPKPAPPPPPPAPKPQPAPKPSPSPTPAAPQDDYQSTILHHHNIHRANHSAPALQWDDTLAGYAKNIASGCVFAHDMSQGGGGYGQNLASWGSSGDIDSLQLKAAAQGVTDQWYNGEMPNWSYWGEANPPSGTDLDSWGHFTQVVWKDSTKVGCYTAKCPAGTVLSLPSWYTVCNYNPAGNFGGEYGANVLKPIGDAVESV